MVPDAGPGPASGTIYCSALCIDPQKGRLPAHRKLVPTYEERLAWGQGDGHGLRAHAYANTRVSTLNCWENWMPQPRHALYADGAEVHVALWPGAVRLTEDITRFIAREGRVFCISAGALMRRQDVPADFVLRGALPDREWFYDGGSAIAGPDGKWVVEPTAHQVGLIRADLDLHQVAAERQNFDPTGHYARPDVFEVTVDRRRQTAAEFIDD
jgi:nitrilase